MCAICNYLCWVCEQIATHRAAPWVRLDRSPSEAVSLKEGDELLGRIDLQVSLNWCFGLVVLVRGVGGVGGCTPPNQSKPHFVG